MGLFRVGLFRLGLSKAVPCGPRNWFFPMKTSSALSPELVFPYEKQFRVGLETGLTILNPDESWLELGLVGAEKIIDFPGILTEATLLSGAKKRVGPRNPTTP